LLGKGNHDRAVEVQRDRHKRAGQLTMPRKKRPGGRYARPRFYSGFYLHLARVLLCTLPSPTPSTRTCPSLTCHLRIVVRSFLLIQNAYFPHTARYRGGFAKNFMFPFSTMNIMCHLSKRIINYNCFIILVITESTKVFVTIIQCLITIM